MLAITYTKDLSPIIKQKIVTDNLLVRILLFYTI